MPQVGPGRPRLRPAHVLGDKGYSSRAIRTRLRRRGIAHTIPEPADQIRDRLRRGSRGGRPPPAFDRERYATRYDKTAESYQAAVTLAPDAGVTFEDVTDGALLFRVVVPDVWRCPAPAGGP
uniref:hypothetical protein n=1 Tax=Streptomyces sp. DG1A-41 TaxID=3125779 RepID=UPI0040403F50